MCYRREDWISEADTEIGQNRLTYKTLCIEEFATSGKFATSEKFATKSQQVSHRHNRAQFTNSPDCPEIDGQMRETVHALDVSDTHEPSSSLLEEVAEGGRGLLSDDTVDASTGEATSPGILGELEILCKRAEIPGTLVLHLAVGEQEGAVNTKDWPFDDRVLEVEPGEIVSDTDAVGDGKVPVLPVPFTVVENDALSEVVRGVADKVEAAADRLGIGDGLFVHVQDPVVDTERDVVTEVVESSGLVLGLAERRDVVLRADDVLEVWVDVGLVGETVRDRKTSETAHTVHHGRSTYTMVLIAGWYFSSLMSLL